MGRIIAKFKELKIFEMVVNIIILDENKDIIFKCDKFTNIKFSFLNSNVI